MVDDAGGAGGRGEGGGGREGGEDGLGLHFGGCGVGFGLLNECVLVGEVLGLMVVRSDAEQRRVSQGDVSARLYT